MTYKRLLSICIFFLSFITFVESNASNNYAHISKEAANLKLNPETLISDAIQHVHSTQYTQNTTLHQYEKEAKQQLLELVKSVQSAFHSLSMSGNGVSLKEVMELLGNQNMAASELADWLEDTMELWKDSGEFSQKCINDTGNLIIAMVEGKEWALKFLDAAGKPGPGISEFRFNYVGDYHLCRKLEAPPGNGSEGFKGSYSTLKAGIGQIPFFDIQWGVCLPDSCHVKEITSIVAQVINAVLGDNSTIHVLPAEIHTDKREASFMTRLAIVYLVIIVLCMLGGTLYDVLYIQRPVWRAQLAREDLPSQVNGSPGVEDTKVDVTTVDDDDPLLDIQEKPRVPDGKLEKILLAHSVYSNTKKVLNTKLSPDSISCVHGIRCISMLWVILGHVHYYGFQNTINSVSEYKILFDRWSFRVISNAFVSVDTFFLLSGLLTAYVTIGHFKKTGRWMKWRFFYLHRYLRLTLPYALVILVITGFHQYCGEGPLWPDNGVTDIRSCETHWWGNLLYINNIVNNNADSMCLLHTWYLANDMQFFLISPILMIALCFHKKLGVLLCCTVLLASALTTGIMTSARQWPATVLDLQSPGLATWFNDYYIAPWCRIGPFIIGILTGYFLVENPRKKITMTRTMAAVGWTVATLTALASLYGIHGNMFSTHLNTPQQAAAMYNAVARDAWSLSVAWVIVACVTGWGGFVNTFLSWSPFVFLGRLSFMAYLIHPALLLIFYNGRQTLFYVDPLTISLAYMGIVVATYSVSFILMLAFESPMVGIERVFLRQKNE